MSVTSKEKLFKKLRDKEYRDYYCEEHVKNGISFQVMALRDQRGWSQTKLATEADTKQSVVSRIENPDYGNLTISTLTKLANAFDVGLIVKFAPFSKFLKDKEDLSSSKLIANSFKDDQLNIQAWSMQDTDLIPTSNASTNNNLIVINSTRAPFDVDMVSAVSVG